MANPSSSPRSKEETQGGNFGQFGTEGRGRGQETGTSFGDKAKEVASNVSDTARDAASSAAHTASEMASNVGQKAEDATSSVGSSMKSLAGTLRERGPHGGFAGQATSSVADSLERGGRYLEEQGLRGIGEDLTNLIRRNPIPALLVGIGVGYLLARATRS